eukprot:gene15562-biopygen17186
MWGGGSRTSWAAWPDRPGERGAEKSSSPPSSYMRCPKCPHVELSASPEEKRLCTCSARVRSALVRSRLGRAHALGPSVSEV